MTEASYPSDFDYTKGDSGLPDNYDGRIQNAEFKYDPAVGDGLPLLLVFDLVSLDEDVDDQVMKVKLGKGWEAVEAGRKIVREDGRAKNFHKMTHIFKMIESLVKGGVDVKKLIKERGTPMTAAFWEGLTCHWDIVVISYGGDIGDIDRLLPTKVLNAGSVKVAAGKVEVDFTTELTDLASEAESYAAFRAAAYEQFPDLVDSDSMIALVESEDFYRENSSF